MLLGDYEGEMVKQKTPLREEAPKERRTQTDKPYSRD